MSTIISFPAPDTTARIRETGELPTRLDREPTETELHPFAGLEDVCSYCGRPQTDEQAEHRTRDHIVADLLAIHRHSAAIVTAFGTTHPGYDADVYDLLCELDTADQDDAAVTFADMAVAQ